MTESPTTKENKTGIGNWLAGWFATQYSERVDWLWFGSMLLVIGGTAIKFGPGYVPLFVALKGVLFVRFFQKEISKLPLPIVITGKPEPVKSKLNLWLIGIFNVALLSLYWIIRDYAWAPYACAIGSIILTNIFFVIPFVMFPRDAYAGLINMRMGNWHFAMIVLAWTGMAWLFFRYDLGYANMNNLSHQDGRLIMVYPLLLLFTFYFLSIVPYVILRRRKP